MQFSCGLGQQRRRQTSQSKPQREQWVLILGKPCKLLKDAGSIFCKSLILSTDAASDAKRSVPLVASDSSSSGGSDSEEDAKTTSGPPNTISTCVPGNKPDHLKRLVHYFPNCESFCGAIGAAEAHKTAASGWSSYIWHITTRLILITDWTLFFFPPGSQMWLCSLYSALSQLLFFYCFILWLCAANSICALGWCHTNPVCQLSGICVTSQKPKEGRGSAHAEFELRLIWASVSVFCVQRGESGLSGKAPTVGSSRSSRAAGVICWRFTHSLKDRQQVRNYGRHRRCHWFDCFFLEKGPILSLCLHYIDQVDVNVVRK